MPRRAGLSRRFGALALGLAGGVAAMAGCGGSGPGQALPAHWTRFAHVPGIVDLAGPRTDGSYVAAADGRLLLLSRDGALSPFARGAGGYATSTATEPYIALAGDAPLPGLGCSFPRDTLFALVPGSADPGLIAVDPRGRARRYVSLPHGVSPNGIAYDAVGRFGHRLLITAAAHGGSSLFAVGCRAGVTRLVAHGPPVEGGMAVAPAGFGRFGGDLIAPNETSGRIYAFRPGGQVVTLARSGLPSGGDIGVESTGFVPPGFGRSGAAYLADRGTPGNRHPGTNSLLALPGAGLTRAGVRPGDLLVATEGGAETIAIRCAASCTVRHLADGPAPAHAEGHLLVVTARW